MNRNNRLNNSTIRRGQAELQSQTSLSSQLKRTWPIALLGFLGLTSGILVIVWNEARAVETTKLLEEAILSVTQVSPDYPIDKNHIGKLLYITGIITVQEPLTEIDYGVSVSAVKLKRRVQMYQWVEEETQNINAEGNVIDNSYYYYTEWRDKLIDSTSFAHSVGHWNPKEFPIKSQTQINENVKIGYYNLGLELKEKFNDYVEITSDERPERRDIKLHAGLYYHSHDVWNPEIGDIRIQFSYAGQHGQIVTLVAMLDDTNSLVPFKSKHGLDVLILRLGFFSLEDVFTLEHAQNRFVTWLYRGGGWALMYLGCICLSNILRSLIMRSRLLRDVLPTSHSSLKMTVSMSMSIFVTALAWMWYRPILGIFLVIVTLSLLLLTKYFSGNHNIQNNYNRL